MVPPDTMYVEGVDGRLYQLDIVPGYPVARNGRRCKVRYIPDEQRFEVSDRIRAAETAALVAQAMGVTVSEMTWRLVPVRGRVNAVAPKH